MNKTKEEILRAIGNSYRYSSEGFLIDHDILADNILMLYDLLKAHLTDQIKSMENYISDVDGQVKELREENEIQGNYNDMLIKELESLQKENAKLTIILSADNSDKLDLENKVKEYEELMMDLEDSYMDWIDAEGTQNDGRFSVEVNNIRIKAKALTN